MLPGEVLEVLKTELDKAMADLIWCWEVKLDDLKVS